MRQLPYCADVFITAPCCLGYLCMADKFCERYLRATKKKELLFLMLSFGGWLLFNLSDRWFPVPYILSAIMYRILLTGLVVLLYQAGWEKKVLAASILMNVGSLVENMAGSLLSCLILYFRHAVKKIPEPCFREWEIELTDCISFGLAALALYAITGYFKTVFQEKTGRWYVMLAAPLFVLLAVSDVAAWGAGQGIMIRSGGTMGLYYDQLFSHMEFCILSALSMTAAVLFVFGMNRVYLEQEKSGWYHAQIEVYKTLTEQYRQSERLRHDMKNHILALSALFRNQEWDRMGDYLKNMEGIALDAGVDMTGNKTVDALLYQKRKRAQEADIRWECDVQIPEGCGIHEFDLCILFGNLLDNALEACNRIQISYAGCCFISVQAKAVKKCFLIEIKNSMDETEKAPDGFEGQGTAKGRGIGLCNVSDVVHGHQGVLELKADKGIFAVSVLIPMRDV